MYLCAQTVATMNTKLTIFICFLILTINGFGQIEGKVIDEKTKEVIPFAKVQLIDIGVNTTTNEKGVFSFDNVPSIHLNVKVSAFDYSTELLRLNFGSSEQIIITLSPQHTVFEEVIVSGTEGKLQGENITSVDYRSRDYLFQTGATTLGEALTNIPGVQQNTIGTGISRPVIRGLSGTRVITYWEGLRIENQQWGEDHGMAISELGLKGVEVVKGPSSLMYGADAVGGVIQFYDEDYAPVNSKEIYATTKFESNTVGTTNEVGFKASGEKFKVNVFANYISHTDFQLTDGDFLDNSRFWATNWKVALGYRNNNYVSNLRYHGSYSQLGIPGHTHDLVPDASIFISDRRGLRSPKLPAQFIENHFVVWDNELFFKNADLKVQIGNTNNHLREFDHDREVPFTNLNLNNTFYHVRYHQHLSEKTDIKIGSQGMYQANRNLDNTESFIIPDANSLDFGAYAILNHDLTKKWRFQTGVRYDYREIETLQDNMNPDLPSNIDMNPLSRNYATLNYAAGFVRNAKRSTVRFNASSGFRAPHLAELLADGVHHGSLRYEKGDRSLTPENALQLDASLELHFDHFEFIINPYVSFIRDFIYLQVTDSVVTSSVGTFPYFEFSQTDNAIMYGGEVAFHYHPHQLHRLHLESSFSVTIAEDQDGTPINLIPQPNFTSRVRFDVNSGKKFKVKNIVLEHHYFLPQNRVAPLERASDAYGVFNFAGQMQWELKKDRAVDIKAGVRNLLNNSFIPHLSILKNLGTQGIANPGINFYVKLAVRLGK